MDWKSFHALTAGFEIRREQCRARVLFCRTEPRDGPVNENRGQPRYGVISNIVPKPAYKSEAEPYRLPSESWTTPAKG